MSSATITNPSNEIRSLFSESLKAAIPEGGLSVSQWADQYRFLSPERSERSGRWKTDLVPYLREIMDEVSNPETSEVVLVKSSQIAGTEFVVHPACALHGKPLSVDGQRARRGQTRE